MAATNGDAKPAAPWSSDFGHVKHPHFRAPEGNEWVRLPGLFRGREVEEFVRGAAQRWRLAVLPHGLGPDGEELYVVLAAPLDEGQ